MNRSVCIALLGCLLWNATDSVWAENSDISPDIALPVAPTCVILDGKNENSKHFDSVNISKSGDREDVISCLPSPAPIDVCNDSLESRQKSNNPASFVKSDNIKQISLSSIATDYNSPAPPEGVGYKLTVKAYAYCLTGKTSSGTYTNLGTVAVDKRVIPLGTKIYIPGYGWGVARDTGGHMRGNVIDIWYPSYSQCRSWGVRDVTVTVLR